MEYVRRAAILVALVSLAACGGGSPKANNTLPPIATSSAPATSSPQPTQSLTGKQTITVTPHTGLKNGQTVHVVAVGFSPNQTLGVIECADKGNATGEGDCDISALKTVTSDAHGRVVADFKVIVGPFGTNNDSCSTKTPCLVSVSQQTLVPTEEANARISFG